MAYNPKDFFFKQAKKENYAARSVFKIQEIDKNTCGIIQHARFAPHGLFGLLYWYALIPMHEYIFGGMIKKIVQLAQQQQ